MDLSKARMDRKRLRDALRQVIVEVEQDDLDKSPQHRLEQIQRIAVSALTDTEEPGELV